jgi:sec-independent protein translocase protein TatC
MYYFREFRYRIFYISFLFLIFFFCYYIYFIDFLGYFNSLYASILLKQQIFNYFFIFTHPIEPYLVQIQFCVFFGSLSTCIYCLWQSLDFFKSSLYSKEFYIFKMSFFTIIIVFSFSYYILISFFISYIASFLEYFTSFYQTKIFNFYMELRLTDMLNFILIFHFGYFWILCIVLLQCFLFLIIPQSLILRIRKLLYLVMIIISTLITPPDVISQCTVFFSLSILLELILFCRNFQSMLRQSVKTN